MRRPRDADAYVVRDEAIEGLEEIIKLIRGRAEALPTERYRVNVELRFWVPEEEK